MVGQPRRIAAHTLGYFPATDRSSPWIASRIDTKDPLEDDRAAVHETRKSQVMRLIRSKRSVFSSVHKLTAGRRGEATKADEKKSIDERSEDAEVRRSKPEDAHPASFHPLCSSRSFSFSFFLFFFFAISEERSIDAAIPRSFQEKETWPVVRKDRDNYFRFSGVRLSERKRNRRILRS